MDDELVKVLWFKEISKYDIPIAGGKGANLGEMINADIPVPNGFVVTADAYYSFIHQTGLDKLIKNVLDNLDVNNSKALQSASEKIKSAFYRTDLPDDLVELTRNYYKKLCGDKDRYVAVRSSATAEDLPEASFAGQQDTFLNIYGWESVVEHVQKVWASLFEARAIFYRASNGFSHLKVGIAVPVQLMVQSEVSGIMFTLNPITNNEDEITIEAAFGLGQPIVSGELTPDQYIVDKPGKEIKSVNVVEQTWQFTRSGKTSVDEHLCSQQKMSDRMIVELAEIGERIEKHYKHPQDIEWGIEGGKIAIVQTRPITTINKSKEYVLDIDPDKKCQPILKGLAASPGIASGKVRIIYDIKEIDRVKEGDVLVAEMTNPDFVPAMKRACAIVTNIGGRHKPMQLL